jgi:signal transduction histidine kinase/ActR/RegA family two-component response regulator
MLCRMRVPGAGAGAGGQSSCPACGAPLHDPSEQTHRAAIHESSDPSRAENQRRRQVHAAETRLLYDNAFTGIVATVVIAAVLAYAQREIRPHAVIVAWLLYVLMVSAARYTLLRRYRRESPGDIDSPRWSMAFAVGAATAAAGWVVAAIVLYAPDEPMNQAFLVFVVGGVMLGGASLLAPRPEAFLTFLLPTGLATALRLAIEGDEAHLMMGFLAATFTAATVTTTWRFHRVIESSLQLRFDNQDLIDGLQAAKDQADAVNRELEQRVRERTAMLTDADQRKNEFLATLAHELRNPLAPIRFAVESLKFDAPPQAAARARDVIERQVRQLVRLVDDLLDVSRITANKIQLRREPHDLARLMETAVESVMPLASAAEQTLEVRAPSTPIHVHGDGARLVQTFTNVLSNAVKFTPRAGHIRFTADTRRDEAVVCIRDTGVGIVPDALPRVFDMFHQAEPGLERSAAGGLGIGLALARRLVEMHEGRIDIRSPGLGQGTEVEIHLPITAVPGEQLAADEHPAVPVRRQLRVLIVEDNRDAAEMLDIAVSRLGHVTRLAHDGAAAVALASEFVPDVILLDIGLPVIDGYAVAQTVRDQPKLRHAYIAAVTGWGQEEDRRKARDAGFDTHFTKPLSPAALEDVLDTVARRMTSDPDDGGTPRTRRTDSDPAL